MKRPLFWALLCFTFGEVLNILTQIKIQAGVLIGMSAFCVLISLLYFIKRKKYAFPVFVIMTLTGFLCGYRTVSNDYLEEYMYNAWGAENTTGNDNSTDRHVKIAGRVEEILSGKNGKHLVVRVLRTQLAVEDFIHQNYGKAVSEQNKTDNISDADNSVDYFVEVREKYSIICYNCAENYNVGDSIYIKGDLCCFENSTNPGQFDMKKYYRARNISFYILEPEIIKKYESKNIITKGICLLRTSFENSIRRVCSEDTGSIFLAMLIGEKSGLSDELKNIFRLAGIGHILAISGLHISLIGGAFYKLIRKCGIPFMASSIVSSALILAYGAITGNALATIRALIMLIIYLLAQNFGRTYDMTISMSVALFLMLLACPYRIYDGGFLLSFFAVAGVIYGQHFNSYVIREYKLKERIDLSLGRRERIIKFVVCRLRRQIISSFISCSCITLVTMPVIANTYYEISLYSIFVNMLILPIMSFVVISGFAAMIAGIFFAEIGLIIIWPAKMLLRMCIWISSWVATLPFAGLNTGKISLIIVFVYYLSLLVIFLLFDEKIRKAIANKIYKICGIWINKFQWKKIRLILCGVTFLITALFSILINGILRTNRIVFLDVGQGDGILIKSECGMNVMIDGGSSSKEDVGKYILTPALKYYKMATLDYAVVSHGDYDHISGLKYILEESSCGINIKNIVMPEYGKNEELLELEKLANERGVNVIWVNCYDKILCGCDKKDKSGMKLTCLAPSELYESIEDVNEKSAVFMLEVEGRRVLFTGDMGFEGEKLLLDSHTVKDDFEETGSMDDVMNAEGKIEADNAREFVGGEDEEDRREDNSSLSCDILKVGHHGSKYSTGEEFLEEINKSGESGMLAIISVGAQNIYGHPHEETLERLDEAGVKVMRTDKLGAVIFTILPSGEVLWGG